ncbi:MAG: succinate dehydrogenase/fumarate reductase cytochrome b subunit [Prevotella sp.]|nr:succinate dehydrogenase/fumarate reductase cytochrome b subunit [Prevotella sp.]
MWLFNSSIGRKVIMSVTGLCLILFLTFHMSMNVVALFSAEGYNMICEFLGANWYAVVATLGLAALALLHIVYAFILTFQNRAARGKDRYAVTEKPGKVEWASQNMLVLGIIILLGLLLHLHNFWSKMMLAELAGMEGLAHGPADGFAWIVETFSNPVFVVLYIVWLCAIWFHLVHGFWSAMQTLGVNGKIWFNRWRVIGCIYVTLLMLGFLVVTLAFAFGIAPSQCCGDAAECCKAAAACC